MDNTDGGKQRMKNGIKEVTNMTEPSLQNLMMKEAEETLIELFRVPLEQLEHRDILWLASKFLNNYLTGYSEGLKKAREIFFEEKEVRKSE